MCALTRTLVSPLPFFSLGRVGCYLLIFCVRARVGERERERERERDRDLAFDQEGKTIFYVGNNFPLMGGFSILIVPCRHQALCLL